MNKEKFLQDCWTFVHIMNSQLLLIEEFGELRAYLIKSFKSKSRDYFLNEVDNAQDVTTLIQGIELNVMFPNKMSLESKVNNQPTVSFKFGHDNYKWLISVDKNIY